MGRWLYIACGVGLVGLVGRGTGGMRRTGGVGLAENEVGVGGMGLDWGGRGQTGGTGSD